MIEKDVSKLSGQGLQSNQVILFKILECLLCFTSMKNTSNHIKYFSIKYSMQEDCHSQYM